MEASAVIAVAVATDDFGGKEREAFGMLKSLLPVRSSRSSKSKPRDSMDESCFLMASASLVSATLKSLLGGKIGWC